MEEQKLDSKYSYLAIYLFTIPCWNWSLWLQTTYSLSYSFMSQKSDVSQFSSVTQSCLTLCNPMDCSTPGFPVHHQLLELAQTYVHWVSDFIQPSHPLMSSSLSAFNLSQHQGLFQWVALRIRWPKYWSFSFSISPSNEYSGLMPLGLTGWISLQSKGLSRVFSNTTVQKHQFFGIQFSLWPNSHIHIQLLKKP